MTVCRVSENVIILLEFIVFQEDRAECFIQRQDFFQEILKNVFVFFACCCERFARRDAKMEEMTKVAKRQELEVQKIAIEEDDHFGMIEGRFAQAAREEKRKQ